MEFFAQTENAPISARQIQQALQIAKLPDYNASINSVMEDRQTHGVIYCIWGEFAVNREEITQGVRFSLPTCPNAFAWTVTMDDTGTLVVHATINKSTHDEDFIESIEMFVADQLDGIQKIYR